ncbi:hypothetical protein TRVA0_020S00408 [Trichomonascus vanleenenianus]|uniref:uncharacterized protein n=1 Tax=Trichomonascus vanleenenianus TaxID=2268995 RepID=UPI003EC98531
MSQPQTNAVLTQSDYEVIDVDPHFNRVVGYLRASDYAKWGLFTASGPALMTLFEYLESGKKRFRITPGVFRVSTFLGFTAGFFNAYVTSSLRFQGAIENAREVKLDRYEIKSRLAQGKSAYGEDESQLPAWIRRAAAGNSTHSFNYMAMFPWFNFVKHEYHGVDLKKYYETRPGEEEWGFNLQEKQ